MSAPTDSIAFPAPGHDHARCVEAVVGQAESTCARLGVRFTDQRRRVLAIVAGSHQAIGAYEIIEKLAEDGVRPAPITVYRALDFLMANGFVHRIASRNAFVTCRRQHGDHAAVFLICDECGTIGEVEADRVLGVVDRKARDTGFTVDRAVIEVSGRCRNCAADA